MSDRFDGFESRDGYSVATYCDPRYKDVFFQMTETKSHVESVIAEEILAKVQTSNNPPPISRIPSTCLQLNNFGFLLPYIRTQWVQYRTP